MERRKNLRQFEKMSKQNVIENHTTSHLDVGKLDFRNGNTHFSKKSNFRKGSLS